jgi:hypothetical protein
MIDEARPWTDDQLGAHEPSSKPFPNAFAGLDLPLEVSRAALSRGDGNGLAPRLVPGLSRAARCVNDAWLLFAALLFRGRLVESVSTPAGINAVDDKALLLDAGPIRSDMIEEALRGFSSS